jgi:hypothetical protein
MHTLTASRLHHHTERLELSVRSAFAAAGSLLISILTVLILFFYVFLERVH